MIKQTRPLLLVLSLTAACGPAAAPNVSEQALQSQAAPSGQDLVLYDNALNSPFVELSHSQRQAATARQGQALRVKPTGLHLHAAVPLDVSAYSALEFWLNTGSQGANTDLRVQLTLADGSTSQAVAVAPYGPAGTLAVGEWVRVRIPFVDLDPTNLILTDITWRGAAGDIYLDEIKLRTSRADGWMYTQGNRIKWSSGYNFHGRGANIQDGRSCGACVGADEWTSATEVNRRMDTLVDQWGASFVRLTLESDSSSSVLTDPTYLATIQGIIKYTTARGLPVLLSVWIDPSFNSQGWPTAQTIQVWQKLAATFATTPNLIFGLVNEPQQNYDGAQDWDVWNAMNDTVKAIRAVEAQYSNNQHIIAVQGTGGWARRLDFYVKYPISGAGGANIAYETHAYDVQSQFWTRFGGPSQSLPVIIGEYGPVAGTMSTDDCAALQQQAKQYEVPYLAWTFHENCPPNLLVENASGCGINMTLAPTDWGNMVKNDLATAW